MRYPDKKTLPGTPIKPNYSGVISPSELPGDSQAIFDSLMVRFGLFYLPIPPNRHYFGRSGRFRALESHHSHSVEIGYPLHIVASHHHRHREIGAGLTDGADHLATHLFDPGEHVLYSSARLGDSMISSLLALRQRLVLLTLPLNLVAISLALQSGFSFSGRIAPIRIDISTRVRRIKGLLKVAGISRAGRIGDDLPNELVLLVDVD